jgi:hypothetical protein
VDLKKAAFLAVFLLALLGVAYLSARDDDSGSSFEARIPPVEFLYLDGPRVLNFLSELEGGEVGPVHRISKEISSVNAGVGEQGFTVGASSQRETAAESTVIRTESSALGLLLATLEDSDREAVHYHAVELDDPGDLNEIREGMLVRFVTHYLLSPGYIRPYVVVRQSATLAALFPRAAGSKSDAENSAEQRRKAESFVRQVGPDPRLTFAVSPPTPAADEKPLKILLPMEYRGLTQERSLLEKGRDEYTGGRLVIIGKVIRLFRHQTAVQCGQASECWERKASPEYTDYATREIWRNPLEQASRYLIEKVSHSCEMPASKAELRASGGEAEVPLGRIKGRECFLRKLERQTELYAPGAVILPVAIYK